MVVGEGAINGFARTGNLILEDRTRPVPVSRHQSAREPAQREHVRRVAGIETVALGPDWANYSPRFEQTVQLSGFSMVRDLESIDKLPNLTRGLLARGYSESDVEAILGGNLLRVLDSVLPSG